VTKHNKYGVPSKTWAQTRDRNESLDCFVLSLAALRIIAPSPARFERGAARGRRERAGRADPSGRVAPAPRPRWSDNARRGGWLGQRTGGFRR